MFISKADDIFKVYVLKCFPFVREILFILIYRETLVFISLTEHSDSVLDDFVEESSQSSGSTRSYIFY